MQTATSAPPARLHRKLFSDLDAPDLALILSSFCLDLPAKLYRRAELEGLKKNIEIFM